MKPHGKVDYKFSSILPLLLSLVFRPRLSSKDMRSWEVFARMAISIFYFLSFFGHLDMIVTVFVQLSLIFEKVNL